MDDHLDFLVGHVEEPVGLDDLEALVHQGGGVDCNLVPIRQVGCRGLPRGYVLEFIDRTLSKGTAGGREDETRDLSFALEALPMALGSLSTGMISAPEAWLP